MAAYLQKFVEGTAAMPAEIQSMLGRMGEMDNQAVELQKSIDAAVESKVAAAVHKAKTARSRTRAARTDQRIPPIKPDAKLEADCRQVATLADDKVDLARRLYAYVDQRIQALDRDNDKFDTELNRERAKLGLPKGYTAVDHLTAGGSALSGGSGRGRKPHKQKKRKAEPPATAAAAAVAAAAAASPSAPGALQAGTGAALPPFNPAAAAGATGDEPVYCYCKRISFGDMIACDNDNCAIEWFHQECVGLSPQNQPKGKWYCRECEALKKAGKL